MYEVRHAGLKGFGVFATKAISRGTRILAERPTFIIREDSDLYPALTHISEEDRKYVTQLSVHATNKPGAWDWMEASWHVAGRSLSSKPNRPSRAEYQTLLAAFRNNNFDIGGGSRAIFRDICMLNHSCHYNAQGNYNEAIGSLTIHAVKPIDTDDEITISYLVEHGATRDLRQARLHQGYGFECKCPACDLTSTNSEEREAARREVRREVAGLAQSTTQGTEPNTKAELDVVMKLIQMFESEGLVGRELATM